MLNALSSGSVLVNVTPLALGGTSSKSGALVSCRQPTHANAASSTRRTTFKRTIMPQHSASKAVSLAVALMMMGSGCRSKPVDRQALFTSHYIGLTDLERDVVGGK